MIFARIGGRPIVISICGVDGLTSKLEVSPAQRHIIILHGVLDSVFDFDVNQGRLGRVAFGFIIVVNMVEAANIITGVANTKVGRISNTVDSYLDGYSN